MATAGSVRAKVAQRVEGRARQALPVDRIWRSLTPEAEAAELRRLREKLDLTQEELAYALRVTTRTYGAWENLQGVRGVPFSVLETVRAWVREIGDQKRR